MTHSASVFRLASEFDDFLFAPIDDDGNGMLLSVLSALTRLNLDPGQEAADLARLQGDLATRRLVSLIEKLPSPPSAHRDTEAIAARLIALLPRRVGTGRSASTTSPDTNALTDAPVMTQVILYVIIMAAVLAAQSLIASHQPAARAGYGHAPAPGAVSPETPPPRPGRSRSGGLE
jgi:hypothetical protein